MNKPTYEELAAQVELLRGAINATAIDAHIIYTCKVILNKEPAACLAQVKADAGRVGFVACLNFVCNNPEGWSDAANQYAERIR